MSVEVADSQYLLVQPRSFEALSSDTDHTSDSDVDLPIMTTRIQAKSSKAALSKQERMAATQSTSGSPPPFRYGMLHDLESIWWIALWWLFRTVPSDSTLLPIPQANPLYDSATSLFRSCPSSDSLFRRLTLIQGSSWDTHIQRISPEYAPIARYLSRIRFRYLALATQQPVERNLDTGHKFYHQFRTPLRNAAAQLKGNPITVTFWDMASKKRRDSESPSGGGSKRQRLASTPTRG
jgi:hypothetical protein